MNISFKGIKILDIQMFREYYCFDQLVQSMQMSIADYKDFAKSCFPDEIYKDIFCSTGEIVPEMLLKKPEHIVSEYIRENENFVGDKEFLSAYWIERKDNSLICINCSELRDSFIKLYALYLKRWDDSDFPDAQKMLESAGNALGQLAENESIYVSEEGAVWIYLYFLICAQTGILPDNDNHISQLKVFLENNNITANADSVRVAFQINLTNDVVLPYYSSGLDDGLHLEVVKFNNTDQTAHCIKLEGTTVFRMVPPSSVIFAIRSSGKYIDFLPRAFIYENTLFRVEQYQLIMQYNGEVRKIDIQGVPACWAHSNLFGTLILKEDGQLEENGLAFEYDSEKRAVAVSTSDDNYAILYRDGSLSVCYDNDNCFMDKRFINVNVGTGCVAAIDSNRRICFSNNTDAEDISAVCVRGICVYGKRHYVCLLADGSVATDSGNISDAGKKYCAVDICSKGYVLASDEDITLFDFDLLTSCRRVHAKACELFVSDESLAWSDAESGEILSVSFKI